MFIWECDESVETYDSDLLSRDGRYEKYFQSPEFFYSESVSCEMFIYIEL